MITLKTRLGCFNIEITDKSFFFSHNFNPNEINEGKKFFENFQIGNQKEIYKRYLSGLKLKLFFWHDVKGITELHEITDEEYIKIMSLPAIMKYLKDPLKLQINIDERNYLFVGFKDKSNDDSNSNDFKAYLSIIEKNFNELKINETKNSLKNENILENNFLNDTFYNLALIHNFKNFIAYGNNKTLCFFDKNATQLTPDFCAYSKGIKKHSKLIRGSGMFFSAIIPVSMKNDKVCADFDEKLLAKKLIIAEEMFNIIFDFIYTSKGSIEDYKENADVFDEIKDNVEIVNGEQDLRFKIDFFNEKKGINFGEFLAQSRKKQILHYFGFFYENHAGNFEESFKSFIIEKSEGKKILDFEKLIIDFLIKSSKEINKNFLTKNQEIFYDLLCEELFSQNFEESLNANPLINLGVSEFFLKNTENFSINPDLEQAVHSLMEAKAYSPVKATNKKNYYDEAKNLLKKSLELNQI
ncbi:MAG: hypothetical protein PHG04_00710 [Candidatus Nanoarchaeia archaeon]|nr:hypothetical protein [Candidatus Nanoarchaeia archaeon]MDD5053884.1 hypothetical protein [Candidatus Nanoarchaeia archaeon]